jgi:hypothetical protein
MLLGIVVQSVISSMMLPELAEAAKQDAPAQGPPPEAMAAIMYGSTACGLVFSLALPILVLIWFSRRKVKEEVVSWQSAGAQAHDVMAPPGA